MPPIATTALRALGALALAAACHTAAAAPLAGDRHEALFAEAIEEYSACHYSVAFGRFVALADAGHPEAARIALQMLRYGPELYGTERAAAPSQIAAWRQAGTTHAQRDRQLVAQRQD